MPIVRIVRSSSKPGFTGFERFEEINEVPVNVLNSPLIRCISSNMLSERLLMKEAENL